MVAFALFGTISTVITSGQSKKSLKRKGCLGSILLLFGALCIVIAALGVSLKNVPTVVTGTLLYAIFTFPSFPLMMELIGKRVGKDFDLVATGNVFVVGSFTSTFLYSLFDYLITSNGSHRSMQLKIMLGSYATISVIAAFMLFRATLFLDEKFRKKVV